MNILNSMEVVGYVRVSTEQQIDKYGIPTQIARIEKFCQKLGCKLHKIFLDAGKSGAMKDDEDEPKNRSEFLSMLQYIEENPSLTGVVVVDTKRLWRNENAQNYVCKELRKRKVDIHSIDEKEFTLYPTDPIRKFTNTVIAAIAELDYGMINKRLADGRKTKAGETGNKPAGKTPFGYKYSADKKTVQVNLHEAKIVRELFQMRTGGARVSEIVKTFAEKGYYNRNDKLFSKQSITYMLQNPFYCGILTHAGEQIQGKHEPLVSRKEWQELNPDFAVEI
ncbi:MAG: recombinase family protein [Clostridia bacterium]|nr:recombinase family protein [Clostridia bacterium]